jgi:acyl carrier protein
MQVQNNATTISAIDQQSITEEDIQNRFTAFLAKELEVEASEIDIKVPFDVYGLDSATAVELSGDLEKWLNLKLPATLLYDYPTIQSLSKHLVELL